MINQAIEERAEKLLKETNSLTAPIKLAPCAKHLGIELSEVDLEDNVSGFLALDGATAKLGYNKKHSANRQRFTVAHEIGHYVLHAMDMPLFIDKTTVLYNRNENSSTGEFLKEREANSFAAALLMPKALIHEHYQKSRYQDSISRLIRELAILFEVSDRAMGIRLTQLGYLDYDNSNP